MVSNFHTGFGPHNPHRVTRNPQLATRAMYHATRNPKLSLTFHRLGYRINLTIST